MCPRRLNTAGGLAVHLDQVHKVGTDKYDRYSLIYSVDHDELTFGRFESELRTLYQDENHSMSRFTEWREYLLQI